MENTTKALLIAGGVLIALIIITMFILMFNRISNIQKEQEEQTKIDQLTAFNAEFEAYNKKLMFGADVITLINKAMENNKQYAGNNDYKITIILDDKEVTSSSHLIETDAKTTVFKCTKIEYNNLGRVSKLEIKTK